MARGRSGLGWGLGREKQLAGNKILWLWEFKVDSETADAVLVYRSIHRSTLLHEAWEALKMGRRI